MATIQSNGITLEYDSRGEPGAPVVLLIMGLGMQLIAWPDPFCEGLAQRGFRVLRFDNRDCGLSQKMDHLGVPRLGRAVLRALLNLPVHASYDLDDMAQDTIGLLDALGIESAHVVGASMGGMIAQQVAARHPRRTRSLTSIMSTSGARYLPKPSRRIRRQLLRPPADPANVDCVVDQLEQTFLAIGSPDYPTPREEMRARLRQSVERGYNPAGFMRQLVAILASGDRSDWLEKISSPTLVIHGKADPLVPYQAGVDTALKIRDSQLALFDGYGHDFPPQLLDRFVNLIANHAKAASGR
jgi:pimeloyl-ACP methyl ester carboxylesterase